MSHVDDGQLHAYLDGELALLDAAGGADLERHLASCAECRARLEQERAARERAHAILRGSGPIGLSEPDFEALAARTRAPRQPARRRVRPAAALAWAASVVLALGLGWFGRELLRSPELQVAAETSADAASRPEAGAAAPAEPEERSLAAVSPPQAETAGQTAAPAQVAAPAPAAARARAAPAARAPERPAAPAAARADAATEVTMAEPEPGESLLALEEIVVTGATGPRVHRRAPDTAAQAAAPAALPSEMRWEPVARREAERRLGGRLRLVPGLRVIAIAGTVERGEPLVRTHQELEGGGTLELLQRREAAGGEAFALRRQAQPRAEREAAAAPPAADVAAGAPLATLEIRRGGYRITAFAPLPADSLRALLSRVP